MEKAVELYRNIPDDYLRSKSVFKQDFKRFSITNSIADNYSNSDFDVYCSQETYKLRGKVPETGEQQKTVV